MTTKIIQWEIIAASTNRLKVFGGWMVETQSHFNDEQMASSSIFVPDLNADWVLEKE